MDDSQYPDLSALIGKRVRLPGTDAESGKATGEVGYIIHAWIDDELDAIDCYVAFVGSVWPPLGVKPDGKPYVLRYLLSSLQECP
jgi:hypothetical protein